MKIMWTGSYHPGGVTTVGAWRRLRRRMRVLLREVTRRTQ